MALSVGNLRPAADADRWGQTGFQVQKYHGFTIVELITVVMLLGILSVTAISRIVKPSAFAPGIVTHAVILQARAAQQLAASRADATVTLTIDKAGDQWRLSLATDVDGVLRTELVAAENTTLTASSGGTSALIDASTPLAMSFDQLGDLETVLIGAAAGVAGAGVNLQFNGDSARSACVYPSGYAADAGCG